MCENCWREAGSQFVRNEKVDEAVRLIEKLYETEGGGVGGYGHIVFDDDNIDTGNIQWCIDQAEKDELENPKLAKASLKVLRYFETLSMKERWSALSIKFNYHL